jgi:hypothetical protein
MDNLYETSELSDVIIKNSIPKIFEMGQHIWAKKFILLQCYCPKLLHSKLSFATSPYTLPKNFIVSSLPLKA